MVLGITWPWARKEKSGPKTINIFLGYLYVLNFGVGTGFLGVPYAFFYSGYMAAIPTLLLISAITWINSNYLLEIMARAQAVKHLDHITQELSSSSSGSTSTEDERDPLLPNFEIVVDRKFEISEMCEIFVNRYFKYTYLVFLIIYSFLRCWSFSTVAASAWATNIPIAIGAAEQCTTLAFFHSSLPADGGCLYSYYFCLVIFAVIVITISLFELREQAIIQFSLGILRFVAMGAIIVYCIVKLSGGGDICIDMMEVDTNGTIENATLLSILSEVDFNGWVTAIPVFIFATIFLTGLSSVTHPIKQKRYLRGLMLAVGVTTTICYMSLGLVVPLWFKASIQETCTLNWASFTQTGNSVFLRFLSYFIVLFPSLDVIAAYPLVNHVIVNNLYILITGQDTSRKPRHRCDRLLRIFLHIITGILPILAAFGVANLIYVLKYGGLAGFVCYFFPSLLQFLSIRVCKKKFSSVTRSMEMKDHSEDEGEGEGEAEGEEEVSPGLNREQKPLLARGDREDSQSLYMTPYSIRFISHPVCAWIVWALGMMLFCLALIGLFVSVNEVSCEYL